MTRFNSTKVRLKSVTWSSSDTDATSSIPLGTIKRGKRSQLGKNKTSFNSTKVRLKSTPTVLKAGS